MYSPCGDQDRVCGALVQLRFDLDAGLLQFAGVVGSFWSEEVAFGEGDEGLRGAGVHVCWSEAG